MNREEVEDFLNLPGVAGIALMDGRSRPYFYGIDQALNFQQKEALAQGIQQVVETTPPGFEFFEFHFSGHHVYIYKLDHGLILLVLAHTSLIHADYLQAIERLRCGLKADPTNAIATFRLLAGNISLSNQSYWKRSSTSETPRVDVAKPPPASSPASQPASPISSLAPPRAPISAPETPQPEMVPLPQVPPKALPEVLPKVLPEPVHPENPDHLAANHPAAEHLAPDHLAPEHGAPEPSVMLTLEELLTALNQISDITVRYLGPTVVSNYWKATRPSLDWLAAFQIERSAQITLCETLSSQPGTALSPEQQQWAKQWVHAFIGRCSKVIRDFPALLEQSALNDQQKVLLSTDKT